MSEDSGQDKSEDPTEKRITDARKKGQIPRSKELDTFVGLMVSSAMFIFIGKDMALGLVGLMRQQFQISREMIFDTKSLGIQFAEVVLDGFLLVIPFALALMVTTMMRPMMMGGWNFSGEAMRPKLSKFNPVKGLKRMFGLQGVMELLKAVLKTSLILFTAKILFDIYLPDFMSLSQLESVNAAIYKSGDIIVYCFLILSSTLILLVVIDVPYQFWKNKKDMMMTLQEVKDENKQSEGDPQLKGKMRQLQMEMSQGRMMDDVSDADVIVTNPSHYAVALKYDAAKGSAPILVAKGVDLIAAKIRNIATGVDIPIVAAPPLARALHYSTEIGDEIPEDLFLVVAQVLAYVYQLKIATQKGTKRPILPKDLGVPDSFRQS